jgi:signal transduction histidine kinase
VRLVQEAMTNVLRHARASRVHVRLRFAPEDRIVAIVADDGVGFDPTEVLGPHATEDNVGLYGMIERTELAGGQLRIRTAPGQGVVIRAIL